MQILSILILILIVIIPTALASFGLGFLRKRWANARRNPLNSNLLRAPGETLRNLINNAVLDAASYIFAVPFFTLMLCASYLVSKPYVKSDILLAVIYILPVLTVLIFFARKIYVLAKHVNKLRLGYEAETAVGQELNVMMRTGCWVFHDVPAEHFNIDHVVVGATGVLAIETKGRSKPKDDDQKNWIVECDGNTLSFPGWQETKPLTQAQRQAKWLQQWLSSAVGEQIDVKPVLAIPGWYVKLTGSSNVMVFNGKNPDILLARGAGTTLSDKTIAQIAHQLDQRCRTVSPIAYTPISSKDQEHY